MLMVQTLIYSHHPYLLRSIIDTIILSTVEIQWAVAGDMYTRDRELLSYESADAFVGVKNEGARASGQVATGAVGWDTQHGEAGELLQG